MASLPSIQGSIDRILHLERLTLIPLDDTDVPSESSCRRASEEPLELQHQQGLLLHIPVPPSDLYVVDSGPLSSFGFFILFAADANLALYPVD